MDGYIIAGTLAAGASVKFTASRIRRPIIMVVPAVLAGEAKAMTVRMPAVLAAVHPVLTRDGVAQAAPETHGELPVQLARQELAETLREVEAAEQQALQGTLSREV